MKMQFLVSAVKEDVETLAERMNLQADAIIVNQCDENASGSIRIRDIP